MVKKMKKNKLLTKGVILVVIVGLLWASTLPAIGTTDKTMNQDRRLILRVPSEFPTIQSALDFAISGDYVLVSPGTYYENLKMENAGVKLIADSGNPSDTIIDGGGSSNVIWIKNSNCVVGGFTIQNSGSGWDYAGIRVSYSPTFEIRCYISGNIIQNNFNGIYAYGRGYGHILNNDIIDNSEKGVYLHNTRQFIVYHNNFMRNGVNARSSFGEGLNFWDGFQEGNYWDDYEPPGHYPISGNSDEVDRYPFDEYNGWIEVPDQVRFPKDCDQAPEVPPEGPPY